MVSGLYNRHKADLMNKNVDIESDDIKIMLLDSNHTFSATDNVISDVNANEISGTGYSAGGKSLTTKSVTQGGTTKYDADDVSWTSATFSDSHAVIYHNTTNNLITSLDFGGSESVSGGTFKIEWDSAGIITIA